MKRCFILAPHLISVSALADKTENQEIASFSSNFACSFANKHKKNTENITWSVFTAKIPSTFKLTNVR